MKKILLVLMVFAITKTASAQFVSTKAELKTALQNAKSGTTITLANQVWEDVSLILDEKGTATNPIVIQAETTGSVYIEGNSNVRLSGTHIVLTGLIFRNASGLNNAKTMTPLIELNECDDCIVTNNKVDTYNGTIAQSENSFKWILLDGKRNEISYNSFVGKNGVGSIINDNRDSSEGDYTKIHHNYFGNRSPAGGVFNKYNDQDAIRIGNSETSLFDSFTEVYDNYFYDFFGEVEIISNKSGSNKYYNNTFRDYSGTLTLRHGNNCDVYGNFFFAEKNGYSGGLRIMGQDHKIYNNYIQDINSRKPNGTVSFGVGGINITNGREDTELNGYYQVKNTVITNNTFVNCDYGIRMGTRVESDLLLVPIDIQVSNNIFLNTTQNAYEEYSEPSNSTEVKANITQNGKWDLQSGTDLNITVNSGLLTEGSDFHVISSGSPGIDYGSGNFPFLTKGILGGTRSDSNFDAGAEEFGANGTRTAFKVTDVGVNVGFGSKFYDNSTEALITSTNAIAFGINPSDSSFNIFTNIKWEITSNSSWINVNPTSGTGNSYISFSISENTTGSERTGDIVISQQDGSLTQTVSITQTTVDDSRITTSTNTLSFNQQPGSNTFDIDSNITWEIISNSSWINVTPSTGLGNNTVSVSVLENTSGSDRQDNIIISQIESSLTRVVSIIQTATQEIIPVGVTGVGTENPHIPENVLDGDDLTRWTGDSTNEAYLDFDLDCKQTVTGVSIQFHKGNERSSIFKILTSNDNISYEDFTGTLTSSGTALGFEQFDFSSPIKTQYLRIQGLGNSNSEPNNVFNSYLEVNILGIPVDCDGLSVDEENIDSITIYPIPVTDGKLTIKSPKIIIHSITIYSITGKLLTNNNYTSGINSVELDLSTFNSGLYFVKINNAIVQKLVID